MTEAIETDFRKSWGPALKARRDELGMSQSAVADAAGLRQQVVSQIENGEHYGTEVTRLSLARALRIEVHELFRFPPVNKEAS